jgi:mRNA interferase MazF
MLKGQIYYIHGQGNLGAGDYKPARPAVILGNNDLINELNYVQVVYLTTHPRGDLPTHVVIHSTGTESTVMCERVSWVEKSRIGDICGVLTPSELENVDRALLLSLGISIEPDEYADDDWDVDDDGDDGLEDEDLEDDNTAEYILELMRVRGERDAYKEMLEKFLGSGAGK